MFNLQGVDYYGKTDRELVAYSKFHEEALLECERTDEIAWEQGKATECEKTVSNIEGVEKILNITKVPLFHHDNTRKGIITITNDITNLKKAEQELTIQNQELRQVSNELSVKNRLLFNSQNKFQNLFEQSPVSLWEEDFSEVIQLLKKKKDEIGNLKTYFDEHSDFVNECISKIKILNVNKVTLQLLGVKTQEELIAHIRRTNSKKAFEVLKQELLAFASNKKKFKGETEFYRTNGEVIRALIKSVIIDEKGTAIASVIDITSLKKAEQELLESGELNRSIMQSAGDAIISINSDGIILSWNKASEKIFGYKASEMINNTLEEIMGSQQIIAHDLGLKQQKKEDINKSLNKSIETTGIRKNGTEFPIDLNVSSWVVDNQRYYTGIIRDITERKKIESDLLNAKDKAEESDKLKTEFLNNMSHEIRTPMSGILSFSQFLDDPDLTVEKRKTFVKIIQNSGTQLLQIIDDILEISRLGTKQVKVEDNEVCLNNLLLDLFSIFDLKAKERKIPLYIENGLSDSESTIITDISKLIKIISNLLENALKFTNEGFVKLGYVLKNNEIEIFVEDTGIGIKKEKQIIIFERFSQAEKELSKKVGGLGLGLSIAKENAELLGGEISVTSNKGEGATFYVIIPYNPVYHNLEIEINQYEHTILIAEDEEVNYLYLETILVDILKLNCLILHAKNGEEAIEMCKNNSTIDLILMDLKMPIMNGFEATKNIRTLFPKIPIIAQTAYSTKEEKKTAIEAGCTYFISKPINKESLINIINNYLKEIKKDLN